MSGTYLYLVRPETIAATVEQVEAFQASRAAFDSYLANYWGEVRYSHEAFLRDLANRKASGREVYYLAHALVVNRKEVESVSMDVELQQLFLDCEWLPAKPEGTIDAGLERFYRARRTGGFRVHWRRSPGEEMAALEMMQLRPAVMARVKAELAGRRYSTTEADLVTLARSHGLSENFARDLVLLNQLGNRDKATIPSDPSGYPMWILSGWDNYEGFLTAADLAALARHDRESFLSLFKKAAEALPESGKWQGAIVERLAAVGGRAMECGPDTLCIAISSV